MKLGWEIYYIVPGHTEKTEERSRVGLDFILWML